ncbi:MAG: class I SAM-dependent methyltransferase [Solirubrobacterales bacterium]|nr:class I SAM-dependent methyltransferase [Solirubrobacterales bacterium]
MSDRSVSAEAQVQAEAELAKQLLSATDRERQKLYGTVYDEIYSMHLSRDPATLEFGATPRMLPFLLKLTRPGEPVLEIGCGAGLIAIELARAGRQVTALEVSEVVLDHARRRAAGVSGVHFEKVDGITVPHPDASFETAYSIEVIEHLHEQDAIAHFAEVHRLLRPGGRYWFATPSRLGSVGASERFGVEVAADADVHLKEWTYSELGHILARAGFNRLSVPVRVHRAQFLPWMPFALAMRAERARSRLLRRLLGVGAISVVARR